MGQNQSSSTGGAAPGQNESKTDYYELLGVERTATEEECASSSLPSLPWAMATMTGQKGKDAFKASALY